MNSFVAIGGAKHRRNTTFLYYFAGTLLCFARFVYLHSNVHQHKV